MMSAQELNLLSQSAILFCVKGYMQLIHTFTYMYLIHLPIAKLVIILMTS